MDIESLKRDILFGRISIHLNLIAMTYNASVIIYYITKSEFNPLFIWLIAINFIMFVLCIDAKHFYEELLEECKYVG